MASELRNKGQLKPNAVNKYFTQFLGLYNSCELKYGIQFTDSNRLR